MDNSWARLQNIFFCPRFKAIIVLKLLNVCISCVLHVTSFISVVTIVFLILYDCPILTADDRMIEVQNGTVETLTSDNYPLDYDDNVQEIWRATGPVEYSVVAEFVYFELLGLDTLQVGYGNSPLDYNILVELSGSDVPGVIVSPTNSLWFRLTSYDRSRRRRNVMPQSGFRVNLTVSLTSG